MEKTESSYLESLRYDFDHSPFWKLLGITVNSLTDGEIEIKMEAKPELMNVNGTIHGGVVTSVLDSICGMTIRATKRVRVATISFTTNFMRPVSEGTTVFATARITKAGKRIIFMDAKLVDDQGELVADGTGAFAVINIKSKG
jgi:uncharacterized protein (TIGR00369 family)